MALVLSQKTKRTKTSTNGLRHNFYFSSTISTWRPVLLSSTELCAPWLDLEDARHKTTTLVNCSSSKEKTLGRRSQNVNSATSSTCAALPPCSFAPWTCNKKKRRGFCPSRGITIPSTGTTCWPLTRWTIRGWRPHERLQHLLRCEWQDRLHIKRCVPTPGRRNRASRARAHDRLPG